MSINFNNESLISILYSISRLNASQLKNSTIISDINNEASDKTLLKYLDILKGLFIIDYLNLWNINIRSKYVIRTKHKVYLCDPSIGLILLKINNFDKLLSIDNLNTFRIYFENQVIKYLKVYAQSIGGELYFYRDDKDFEVDAILELNDEKWAVIEIKSSNYQVNEAQKTWLQHYIKIKDDSFY